MTDTPSLFPTAESAALQPPGNHDLNPADAVLEVVARWHNDTHNDTFRFCQQQPCHAVQTAHTSATEDEDPVDIEAAGDLLDSVKTDLEQAINRINEAFALLDY